jgi:rhodanese-related sulfurtransferase
VVDIATPGEPQKDAWRVPIDTYVPFMEPGGASGWNVIADSPEMVFRTDFCARMDEVMRSAHLAYDRPVILVSPSMERSLLAALLLQEHGFTNILVMNS